MRARRLQGSVYDVGATQEVRTANHGRLNSEAESSSFTQRGYHGEVATARRQLKTSSQLGATFVWHEELPQLSQCKIVPMLRTT
ncbi:uncharacterized protein LMH87_007941 [Akanthomyces muscarius]|uniref:Uncharacterized protein n=1 Tax=Akanthomyces muscarius TaxID=2231603 RepID=A0A9W8UPU7_AKAMU|nr:uncharacterized protein LMH87_007941 [Akanthomyces muscarius]KAJ4160006.1 hypothetical protein LMH87_007941 [Akanthomyces muscarius]